MRTLSKFRLFVVCFCFLVLAYLMVNDKGKVARWRSFNSIFVRIKQNYHHRQTSRKTQTYSCRKIDGLNELKQLKKYAEYVQMSAETVMPISKNVSNDNFKYKFTRRKNQPFVFNVKETFHNAPTKGGSSFRVELHEYSNEVKHLRLCHVTDYFTGTYTVCCSPGTSNWTVSVYLMYTNFNAYADWINDAPLMRLLQTFLPKVGHLVSSKESKEEKTYRYCSHPPSMEEEGHWLFKKNKWIWTSDEGCMLKMLKPEQISKCLSNIGSVTFCGASHSRFNYDYLVQYLPIESRPKVKLIIKHSSSRQLNVVFKNSLRVKLLRNLIRIYNETMMEFLNNNRKLTANDVFSYQTGAHDLSNTTNITQLILKDVPKALDLLETKKNLKGWKSVRKVFFSPIPFPDLKRQPAKRHKRNNFAIAALKAMFLPRMRELGFEILDVYDVINPRNIESVDGCHYLRPSNYSTNGLTVLHLFLSNICQGNM